MMKIIKYGLNSRLWFREFEKNFYSKLAPRLKPTYKTSINYLGKSFSFFIFENKGVRNLCMFDVDDGSGLSEASCLINYDFLDKLMKENDVKDYLIFKSQFNRNYLYSEYYKNINKAIPLGYFPENIKSIYKFKKRLKKREVKRDFDLFWIGSVIYNMGEGMIWPKKRSLNYWNYGKRLAGFKALQEISEKRTDLKIICTDKKTPLKEYYNLISRSKICFDFPGVGELTKRFIECLILEKCVMSFKKKQELNFDLKENYHYISIEEDNDIEYTYDTEQNKTYPDCYTIKNLKIAPKNSLIDKINSHIDSSINNLELIETIEKNVSEIQKYLTSDYLISYIREKALKYFFPK